MAATIQQVSEYFTNRGFKHKVEAEENMVVTGFSTENYRDKDGDDHIFIVVKLEEDGEFIKVFAPKCYSYLDGPHKEAVFRACLMISWYTKMLQFEYDPTDRW